MSDIASAAAAAAITQDRRQGSGAAPTVTESTNGLSADFETFLRLLTTQMRSQDPLQPMESTEFAVQLATFSNVEQQVKTNDLLTAMSTQMNILGMSQMAGWVGMEARTGAPTWFDGRPVTLTPQPAAAADRMALVVRDDSGVEVQRHELPPSDAQISWGGATAGGDVLPAGAYSFELESLAKGSVLRTDPLETYSPIVEARNEGGETLLVLDERLARDVPHRDADGAQDALAEPRKARRRHAQRHARRRQRRGGVGKERPK